LFGEAKVPVLASASSALEAEFLSREAYAYLLVGDLAHAESKARQVLEVNATLREPDYFSPIEHSRARAHDVLAFVAARDERYDTQKRHLEYALREFDRTPVRDDVFEAKLLSNLGLFAVDFGDDGYVRERFERLPDSAWLAAPRYEILRSLAWSSALSGDNLGAFRYLRDAIETADTIPKKMRAALDRAYFARQLKQDITAREELDYAERLSARVDWKAVASDEGELHALVILSREIAESLPVRARRLFEKYKALKRKLPADFLATSDRRARAEELEVDAVISRAEGNLSRAISLFIEAFEIWNGLGYGVCAGLAARNLVSLGVTERFAAYVEQQCALRPRSWFAASLRQA
jgi:tetratricopeptide (TPR) repeat protein